MEKKVKHTPLHEWHSGNGANMAIFGGYDMPLWYRSGAKKEHLTVITNAGIFDTSHMALVTVSGRDAFDLLQLCFTKDLNECIGKNRSPLEPGRCVYGAYLNEKGEVIDDTIIGQIDKDSYMSVVNAGMGAVVSHHLQYHSRGRDVSVTDLSDQTGKVDIQGPSSARILSRVLKSPAEVFEGLSYFSFKGHFDGESPFSEKVRLVDDTPLLLSRTGYTGEFGFEMFIAPEGLLSLWDMLLEAGEEFNLIPCGLASRDSLRTGAKLPLSHQDIGNWPFMNNPWTFALPLNADGSGFTKKFIGDEALESIDAPEYTYAFTGYDLRKVSTGDPAFVIDSEGNNIGIVLTSVSDMAIGRHDGRVYSIASPERPDDFSPRGLSCGFVKVKEELAPAQIVELRDKKRTISVEIRDDIRPDRTARRSMQSML
ncbi:MAG: aminomethyl transferase family protein [Deltaproteobacteria bacterium]|nr:aminomethyl transferase family protein [Deltaproteobacteria bacterium]